MRDVERKEDATKIRLVCQLPIANWHGPKEVLSSLSYWGVCARLLLTQTMKASQSPDQFGRIYSYYFPGGKTFLDDAKRLLVFITLKDGNNDRFIGDIKI